LAFAWWSGYDRHGRPTELEGYGGAGDRPTTTKS
jgi:hypothetical protein